MSVVAAAAFLAVAMNSPVAVAASKQMVEGQADSNNMTPRLHGWTWPCSSWSFKPKDCKISAHWYSSACCLRVWMCLWLCALLSSGQLNCGQWTPFFPSFVTVFGQSLGISDMKSYILLKPIMTGSDSQKFHRRVRQKQEKLGFRRKVGYSAGGDLMMMCTNQEHMLLLSPRACTCFFQHQQTNSIRFSAHNCQLIILITLCRSTMCHNIKHHQPEKGTEIHDRVQYPAV